MGVAINRVLLKAQLVQDERDERFPYHDTEGHLTIGIGRNLDAKPLSDAVVALMLNEDIDEACAVLERLVPSVSTLSEPRQRALTNMAFNLGAKGLAGFHQMIAALEARDFNRAADEMLASTWATQVGRRATRLANLMRAG